MKFKEFYRDKKNLFDLKSIFCLNKFHYFFWFFFSFIFCCCFGCGIYLFAAYRWNVCVFVVVVFLKIIVSFWWRNLNAPVTVSTNVQKGGKSKFLFVWFLCDNFLVDFCFTFTNVFALPIDEIVSLKRAVHSLLIQLQMLRWLSWCARCSGCLMHRLMFDGWLMWMVSMVTLVHLS